MATSMWAQSGRGSDNYIKTFLHTDTKMFSDLLSLIKAIFTCPGYQHFLALDLNFHFLMTFSYICDSVRKVLNFREAIISDIFLKVMWS